MALEYTHALDIVTAASGMPSLTHSIWSTLPHAADISNGKYHPSHYQAKNRAEDYIQKELPDLYAKTSFVWVGWYASNFQYPIFKQTLTETSGLYIQVGPAPEDTPINSIGNPNNTGKFVIAALAQPKKTLPGGYVRAVAERKTMRMLLDDWSEVSSKKTAHIQVTSEAYNRLWGKWDEVEGSMLEFFAEYREKSLAKEGLLWAEDLESI